MLKRGYKLIISVVLIAALFLSGSSFAFADQTNIVVDFATLMMYALKASQVAVGSTVAPIQDVLDSITYGAGMPWTPSYTYQGPTWDNDILNLSSITVRPDFVEIDGQMYTDIWLSHDAAEKFRVNAFDLETAWNIVSNSNGTYASGVGYVKDVPMFDIGLYYPVSQWYSIFYPEALSSSSYTYSGSYSTIGSFTPFQTASKINSVSFQTVGAQLLNQQVISTLGNKPISSGLIDVRVEYNSGYRLVSSSGYPLNEFGQLIRSPFEFDWVSGTVPAQQLPSNYGLDIRVPTSYSDPQSGDVIYDFGDLVQEYPEPSSGKPLNFDPSLNPDAQVDVDYTNDLWEILKVILLTLGLWDTARVVYEPYPEPEPEPSPEPTPPPSPQPSTPVSDQPGEWLDEILRWIQETITSVKTATQTLGNTLEQILEQVQTLPQEIMQDIETAPIDIYRRSLEIIKTVFAPVLLLLKSVIGLWHYVVEWVQATAPVFSSFFGFMSSTSYYMVLPIYASLAGPIVIAVYKRFGK